MAESVGREARRALLAEVIQAWVDDIPEEELAHHYARAVATSGHEDLSMLAAWHATLEVGTPLASAEFLVGAFEGSARTSARRSSSPRVFAGTRRSSRASGGGDARHRAAVALRGAGRAAGVGRARDLRPRPARHRELDASRQPSSSGSRGSPARSSGSGWRACRARGRLDVQLVVVHEQASRGIDRAEPFERELVDLGLGLAHADPGRVDHSSKISSTGSFARQSSSHSRTLLVRIAIR